MLGYVWVLEHPYCHQIISKTLPNADGRVLEEVECLEFFRNLQCIPTQQRRSTLVMHEFCLDEIMVLERVQPTIQPHGVGYVNAPQSGVSRVFPYVPARLV